jgi:Lysozyme like domain
MSDLTYAQLEGVWIQGGGSAAMAPLMAAIAEAESGGNPDATNPTDNDGKQTSWGLWQISNGTHSMPSPNWNDPVTNAELAVAKYNEQGLGAWGTYTSGAYKAFLSPGTTPDSTGIAVGSTTTTADATGVSYDPTTCLIGFNATLFSDCFLSRTQGRALIGGLLMGVSAVVFLFGTAVMISYTFKRSGAEKAVSQTASAIPLAKELPIAEV